MGIIVFYNSWCNINTTVQNRLGIDQSQLDEILILSDRKLQVPSVENANMVIEARAANIAPSAAAGISKTAENFLGVISTGVKNISPKAHSLLVKTDYHIATESSKYLEQVNNKQATKDIKSGTLLTWELVGESL